MPKKFKTLHEAADYHKWVAVLRSAIEILDIEDLVMAEKWIQKAKIKKGALHKKLGVPEGKKIPEKKLEKAEKSKNPTTRKQAVLAETFKHMRKKK